MMFEIIEVNDPLDIYLLYIFLEYTLNTLNKKNVCVFLILSVFLNYLWKL